MWVQKWIILKRFSSAPKIIIILKFLHKNVNVKFTVCKVTQILSSIFGVKQGGILDPKLFWIFIATIMITWRKMYDRPLCFFATKKDFILTGCRSTKGLIFVKWIWVCWWPCCPVWVWWDLRSILAAIK